jgi:hypothetical protein
MLSARARQSTSLFLVKTRVTWLIRILLSATEAQIIYITSELARQSRMYRHRGSNKAKAGGFEQWKLVVRRPSADSNQWLL